MGTTMEPGTLGLRILVFDPGDHTGWICHEPDGTMTGGTIYNERNFDKDCYELFNLFTKGKALFPDIVIFETFNLYPGAAPHLAHNEFYPCQIIGAIKYLVWATEVKYLVPQAPSVKRYSGGLDVAWQNFRKELNEASSEHLKDAYLHFRYFKRNNLPKLQKFRKEYPERD